ncbi:ATP phosphoribosyltransferase regulatory subunit, partial [Rhizobium ruizarguesonis]
QKRLIHAFGNITQLEALLASLVSPQFFTGLDDYIARLVASGDEQALVAHLEREMQKTSGTSSDRNSSKKRKAASSRRVSDRMSFSLSRRAIS